MKGLIDNVGLGLFVFAAIVIELCILALGLAMTLAGLFLIWHSVAKATWIGIPLGLVFVGFGVAIARTAFEKDED
jgi:hypothetical protein